MRQRLKTTAMALALACLTSCAGSAQRRALQVGMVAREVVDTGAQTLQAHMQERATACAKHQDREAFDACLGPVARQPRRVVAALEGVRTAQVGLWLALASGDVADIQEARALLVAAMGQLAALVKASKEAK